MPFQSKETFKSTLSLEKKMAENYTSTQEMTTSIDEVDLDNQGTDNDMEAVMKQKVAKSTREKYEISNTTFIPCCLTTIKNPSLLQPMLCDMKNTKNLLLYIGRQHKTNCLNKYMVFDLSDMKRFEQ